MAGLSRVTKLSLFLFPSNLRYNKFMQQNSSKQEILTFPEKFLWGAATSSYQIEGNNFNNNWYIWEKQGKVLGGEVCGNACDFFNHYENDLKIAKDLNMNSIRLSIEWSRIEPHQGEFDFREIERYKKILRFAKQQKLKIFLTLHHFTEPIWFYEKNSFEKKKNLEDFLNYAKVCIEHFGKYVDFWITFNEPMIYVGRGYIDQAWPPGKKNPLLAYRVIKNLIRAHQKVYKIFHQNNQDAKVSVAVNNQFFDASRKYHPGDNLAVLAGKKIWNDYLLKKIHNEMDFIGLNYYFHNRVKFNLKKYKQLFYEVDNEKKIVSDIDWEVYAPGLEKVLLELKKYDLPVYIVENGLADAKDKFRKNFIRDHLYHVHRAIEQGVNVRGYLHWSLLDNFEWDFDYHARFGLIEVDFKTQERRVRDSAKYYAEICGKNELVV